MRKIIFAFSVMLTCTFAFSQTLIPQANKKGLWGYIDSRGKYAIKAKFQEAGQFSEGLAFVKSGNKYGYISELGMFVIPAIYDSAEPFNNQLAICSQNGNYGVIDNSGREIIPFKYTSLMESENHKYYIGKKEGLQSTFIILSDNSSFEYDEINFSEESFKMIPVKKGSLIGYIDIEGNQVVSPKFIEVSAFNADTIAIAKTQDGYGLIDHNRTMISGFIYKSIKESNGLFIMEKSDNDYDLADSHGTIKIENATGITPFGNVLMIHYKGKYSLYLPGKGYIFLNKESMTEEDGVITTVKNDTKIKYNISTGLMAMEVKGKDIWTPSPALDMTLNGNIIVWLDARTNKNAIMTITGKSLFTDKDDVDVYSSNCFGVNQQDGQYLYDANEKLISGPYNGILTLGENHLVVCKNVNRERMGAVIYLPNGKQLTDFILPGIRPTGISTISCSAGQIAATSENVYILQGRGYEDVFVAVDAKTKKKGLFNTKTNKLVAAAKYDDILDFDPLGNATSYILNKGYGLINSKGTVILSNQWLNEPTRIANARHYVIYDNYGGSFYIDANGKRVSEKEVTNAAYESRRNVGF